MVEIVIEIADSLGVPVIAEGVETAEQMFTLKAMGCDIVQGYYFSKPVPAEQFEAFLKEKQEREAQADDAGKKRRRLNHNRFTYAAMHDPLTGLYNHTAFDMLLHDVDPEHTALLLADVDGYDALLAERGQVAAEKALTRVAGALRQSFRASDFVCRIREDEFAVILPRVDSAQRGVILDKVNRTSAALKNPEGDAPAVAISVGIAFGDRENPRGDIFQDADTALSRARVAKRIGCVIY